ncbi:MAG: LptF/LptG family permease [Deltaproteobacteria bacterium]|nr:LptF/LptG family permease [Deltaproteobacteria bacterium]MCL5792983.1 LptF/LptG family permease [Deltaproteobacteria bacterium]
MKVLDKYITRELIPPFLISLILTSALMLIGRMVRFFDLIVSKGVAVKNVALIFVYMSPFILALAIPISILVSVVIVFSRLSADSEIIAMKSIGIKLLTLSKMPIILGLIGYILADVISFYMLPKANIALKNEFFNIVIQKTTVGINEKAFNNFTKNITFYVDNLSKHKDIMKQVFIYDERESNMPNTIVADTGSFIVNKRDKDITLVLHDGVIQQLSKNMKIIRIVHFKDYYITFSTDQIISSINIGNNSSFELTIVQLIKKYLSLEKAKEHTTSILIDLTERLAIPFTAIIFSIMAIPLGIKSPRSGKAYGIIIAIGVVLTYYITLSGAETISKLHILSPFFVIFSVDLVYFVIAVLLLFMVSQEKDTEYLKTIIKRLLP